MVIALLALGVATLSVYLTQIAPLKRGAAETDERFSELTGVNDKSTTNALDPKFTDADGDLVADPPTDVSQQIDPPTLTFSYLALEDDSEFRTAFKGLTEAITKATGKPVQFVSYTSVDDQLRAIREGKLQIAGLNTGAVPVGVCVAGFVPVSQLGSADGTVGSHMEIIVPGDSSLAKLADLRGHTLALTEPNSNSGYKCPLVTLRENGMKPPTDYQIVYSQGHPQSIDGIKNKKFEAAAVAADVLLRETTLGHLAATDYKVIYTSDDLFPGAALGYCHQLKPDVAAKIKNLLTTFDWKGSGLEAEFASQGKTKFVPADYKKNWSFVRRIDDSFGQTYKLKDAVAASQPATQPTAAALPATPAVESTIADAATAHD